jgi:hypothetical protein
MSVGDSESASSLVSSWSTLDSTRSTIPISGNPGRAERAPQRAPDSEVSESRRDSRRGRCDERDDDYFAHMGPPRHDIVRALAITSVDPWRFAGVSRASSLVLTRHAWSDPESVAIAPEKSY